MPDFYLESDDLLFGDDVMYRLESTEALAGGELELRATVPLEPELSASTRAKSRLDFSSRIVRDAGVTTRQ